MNRFTPQERERFATHGCGPMVALALLALIEKLDLRIAAGNAAYAAALARIRELEAQRGQ